MILSVGFFAFGNCVYCLCFDNSKLKFCKVSTLDIFWMVRGSKKNGGGVKTLVSLARYASFLAVNKCQDGNPPRNSTLHFAKSHRENTAKSTFWTKDYILIIRWFPKALSATSSGTGWKMILCVHEGASNANICFRCLPRHLDSLHALAICSSSLLGLGFKQWAQHSNEVQKCLDQMMLLGANHVDNSSCLVLPEDESSAARLVPPCECLLNWDCWTKSCPVDVYSILYTRTLFHSLCLLHSLARLKLKSLSHDCSAGTSCSSGAAQRRGMAEQSWNLLVSKM